MQINCCCVSGPNLIIYILACMEDYEYFIYSVVKIFRGIVHVFYNIENKKKVFL